MHKRGIFHLNNLATGHDTKAFFLQATIPTAPQRQGLCARREQNPGALDNVARKPLCHPLDSMQRGLYLTWHCVNDVYICFLLLEELSCICFSM